MQTDQESIIDQAIGWHVRLAEAHDDAWAEFVAWLEASSAHATAYDIVATRDRVIGGARFPDPVVVPVAANDNSWSRRLFAIGGGVAAAAIAALLVPAILTSRSSPYDVATQPGERRLVALADGTTIEMSGGTRMRFDRANLRVATLEQGEATFHIRHDVARPFAVTTGAITIRDVGTVFNVERDKGRVSVGVAEGSVMFQPGGEAITLAAGDALTANERGGRVSRSKVSPDSVGGWRSGRLSFDGVPVADLAGTLNRLYAIDLTVEASLSARPFTGMVRVTGAADRDVPHLAALIGANWRRDGNHWILSSSAPISR